MNLKDCIQIAECDLRSAEHVTANHDSIIGGVMVEYRQAVLDAFKEKRDAEG